MAPPTTTAAPTAPGAARTAAGPRAAWIDGPWRDLALYVATPLLLVPLILLRPGRPAVQELILYLGAFGALGHHLPGMLRAYGDRALFARFRTRFLVAPIFLVAVCVFFTVRDLGGVLLVTFFWTTWHSLMQIFGFARIYDAKVGSTSRWTARLDHGLCLVWIGAPIVLSDSRLGRVLELWYGSGGPLLPAGPIAALRTGWLVATCAVTLAWLVHTALAWRAGRAPNPLKLALLASSFLFWWFCMATVDHLLVGIALFDIFHDVQYLALVWTFNKARVASDPAAGGFMRFLFRGRMALAGAYVGMVVAYGSIGYFGDAISEEVVKRSLLGVLAASALLHFYFDGFIWKVRERSTRTALSLEGGAEAPARGRLPGGSAHGAKWLFFVVPLGVLYYWDVNDTRPEREWREAIAAAVPGSAEALTALGASLDLAAEPERVVALHRRAVERKPTNIEAHHNLGVALFRTGHPAEARAELLEAVRLHPGYALAHRHLASLLATSGEPQSAAEHFRRAIELDPTDAAARAGLATLRAGAGDTARALALYEEALERDPAERTALDGLAWIRATHPDAAFRDGARAVELAEALAELTRREIPMVLDTLAAAYAEAGRFDEAVSTLAEARAQARASGRSDLAGVFDSRMRRYERGEPWRSER